MEPERIIKPLTIASLVEQNKILFEDPDIRFRPFQGFKTFLMAAIAATLEVIARIRILKTYREAMASPKAKQWKATMDKKIDEHHS